LLLFSLDDLFRIFDKLLSVVNDDYEIDLYFIV